MPQTGNKSPGQPSVSDSSTVPSFGPRRAITPWQNREWGVARWGGEESR